MTENTGTLDSFEIQTEHRSLWVDVWRQFRKHKGALVGMFVFMLITFCVFIGPFIYDVDPNAINFRERNLGPSWSHPLGTDNIGHDTLAQMLAGGRVSLAVGFLAMLISLLIGSLIGVLAGFIKSLDGPLMRLTDLVSRFAHSSCTSGYHHAVQGYPEDALWTRNGDFFPDCFCDWYNQLDAYGENCQRRCLGDQRKRICNSRP